MERGIERRTIQRHHDANQLHPAMCHFWDHRLGHDWIYGMAPQSGVARTDYYRVPGEDEIPESFEKVNAKTTIWGR